MRQCAPRSLRYGVAQLRQLFGGPEHFGGPALTGHLMGDRLDQVGAVDLMLEPLQLNRLRVAARAGQVSSEGDNMNEVRIEKTGRPDVVARCEAS